MAVAIALPDLNLGHWSAQVKNSRQQKTRINGVHHQGSDHGISSVHDISQVYGI